MAELNLRMDLLEYELTPRRSPPQTEQQEVPSTKE
jgi:hypothetical protein